MRPARDFEAEERAYQRRCDAIRDAARGLQASRIARICARFELESDEFYTAEEKAEDMIRCNPSLY